MEGSDCLGGGGEFTGVSCCADRCMECGEAGVAEWNSVPSVTVCCTSSPGICYVRALSCDCRYQYLDKTLANAGTTLQDSIQAMVGSQAGTWLKLC